MSRYIGANAFMKSIRKIRDKQDFKTNTNWYSAYDEFLDLIEDFPTADVVEVVRCKDCKYYYSTEIATASIMCSHMHEDDFCNYGERREDERLDNES